jgi:hypothetical protein
MGFFGFIKNLVVPDVPAAGSTAQHGAAGMTVPESQKLDVFGGDEFGERAAGAVAKAEPQIGDYVTNAVKNFARNKIGKPIAGKIDSVADIANAFGEDNKTETGAKIQDAADWFGGPREKREKKKTGQGLYAIDLARPIINNADGTFSTERTTTFEANGKHYVIPTIIDGKQVSDDDAWELFKSGKNQAVGMFDSADEANNYAVKRSQEIGRVRSKGLYAY